MRLQAMDHNWHRASITPTTTLLTDLKHAFETNKWRNGQVVVTLKDSVLEPSSAFRNAAELAYAVCERLNPDLCLGAAPEGSLPRLLCERIASDALHTFGHQSDGLPAGTLADVYEDHEFEYLRL